MHQRRGRQPQRPRLGHAHALVVHLDLQPFADGGIDPLQREHIELALGHLQQFDGGGFGRQRDQRMIGFRIEQTQGAEKLPRGAMQKAWPEAARGVVAAHAQVVLQIARRKVFVEGDVLAGL